MGFSGGSVVKNLPANAGNTSSIARSGGSSGEGNGNPLQNFAMENPMDKGVWQANSPSGHKRVRYNLETE